jgi:hypothetical protein
VFCLANVNWHMQIFSDYFYRLHVSRTGYKFFLTDLVRLYSEELEGREQVLRRCETLNPGKSFEKKKFCHSLFAEANNFWEELATLHCYKVVRTTDLGTNSYVRDQIVSRIFFIDIRSLFVSNRFELHRLVSNRTNTAVT